MERIGAPDGRRAERRHLRPRPDSDRNPRGHQLYPERFGIVNFGSGPEDTAPERALGVGLRLGEVQTGILYAHFRNDTGEPISSLLIANYRERYRGGDATTIYRDLFFSLDGDTWTAFGGSGSNTQYGFPDGSSYPPSPTGAANQSSLPDTVPPGGEWFFAYRYYATATTGTTAPAMALDQFGIALSVDIAGVVFLNHGDLEYGPLFIGDSEHGGAAFDVIPSSAPAGEGVVTGPEASDFVVTEVEAESIGTGQYVSFEFRPTGPGWRQAELRLFAADTMSRPISLLGFGVERPPLSADESPASLIRLEAWPNPSAGAVRLRVEVPTPSQTRLSVHDPLGREVAVVLDRALPAGVHDATFEASGLPPGIYFIQLVVEGETVTKPLTISR